MKLINYKRGYNNTFDCSIHGTIKMTFEEWLEAYKYLKNQRYDFRFLLHKDIKREVKIKNGFCSR